MIEGYVPHGLMVIEPEVPEFILPYRDHCRVRASSMTT